MKKFKKQIIAGVTIGALVLTGGIGSYVAHAKDSADKTNETQTKDGRGFGRHEPPRIDKDTAARHIADTFGLDKNEILKAMDGDEDFRNIGHAAMLAKISGKSFGDVLALKTDKNDWREVEKSLGISEDALQKERRSLEASRIAEIGSIDKSVAEKLLADGYEPRDIMMAATIAKAAGQDVNTVLAKKKINNRWGDVAEMFGVSKETLFKNNGGPHHKGDGEHRGFDGHDKKHFGAPPRLDDEAK